ncbi:MAG: hypothetical protein FWF36_00780 [Propionibacteriaceae bacterium]|nr:hypothetical protein [Propionibacteriaceae bacterium]
MYDSIPASLFFMLACLVALSGLFLVRKSSKQLSGLGWAVASVVTLTCWHALFGGLFTLIHVPVNLVTIGIVDLAAGIVLWWRIWLRRDRQAYEWNAADWLVTGGLGVATAVLLAVRNGLSLSIVYMTIDPAPHILEAVDVVKNQSVHAMYFHSLTNGLFIAMLSPLTTPDYYYRFFVLSGGLFLLLGGLTFYTAIRRFLKTKWRFAIGVGITFLYVAGYPLNSVLWGFVYLGMSLVLIAHITFLADSLMSDELGKWPGAALLMLGCLGLIVCYTMFVPVVFICLGVLILARYRSKYLVVSKDTLLVGLAVFLIPVVVGLLFMFVGVFTDGVTVGSALSSEGASYRDLFSNFVPFLPVALFGAYQLVKARQLNFQLLMLPVMLVYMAGLLAMGMLGRVSSYYFMKSHYLLWLVVLYLLVVGIAKITNRETAVLLGMYGVVWALIFALSVSGIEHRIQMKNDGFDPVAKSTDMNDILSANRWEITSPLVPGLDPGKQQLYHYVFDNYVKEGAPLVPVVAEWRDAFWYQVISSQHTNDWLEATMTQPDWVMNMVQQSPSKVVLVLTTDDSVAYQADRAYFDSLPRLYSNSAGFVGQLP